MQTPLETALYLRELERQAARRPGRPLGRVGLGAIGQCARRLSGAWPLRTPADSPGEGRLTPAGRAATDRA